MSSREFLWQDGRHEIRIAPFTRRGVKRGVMASSRWLEELRYWPGSIQYDPCPPETRGLFYKAIGEWARGLGARSIGGPVMSGAMLASGIAAVAGLDSFLIDKPDRHPPRRHPPHMIRGICREPFLIVDDLICTAQDMERSIAVAGADDMMAALIMDNRFRLESDPKDVPLACAALKQGRVFGISYKADPPYPEW
jgi:hypothetical protein